MQVDAELPDGTSVIVLALDGDETFEANAETDRMLLDASAECDEGRTVPTADFLAQLRNQE